MFIRPRVFAALCTCLAALNACRSKPPVDVAAMVNNRPITYAELDKTYQSRIEPGDQTNQDQIMIQKLETLRGLIDNEIMLQRAEKLNLMAVDADVEARLNQFKAPYTKEEFQKELDAKKLTVDDLKQQIRRELSIQKLFNNITFHNEITDADVTNYYNANKASFNFAEPMVHVAQILVTPDPDANVRNLRNDKAKNEDQAKKKIHMVEQRLKQGEDFGMIAQNYSEDPQSAPNGGDLGFVPQSALEKVPPELRKVIMAMQPGELSPIVRTPAGYSILKIFSKEPSGQRALNDPRVQQNIRETLRNRKDQLLRNAYYEVARSEAKVTNYFAKGIADAAAAKAAK